jgi:hypothetical protein
VDARDVVPPCFIGQKAGELPKAEFVPDGLTVSTDTQGLRTVPDDAAARHRRPVTFRLDRPDVLPAGEVDAAVHRLDDSAAVQMRSYQGLRHEPQNHHGQVRDRQDDQQEDQQEWSRGFPQPVTVIADDPGHPG